MTTRAKHDEKRNAPAGSGREILQGRQLMRKVPREPDGGVLESKLVEACEAHPELLWRIVHRYPFE